MIMPFKLTFEDDSVLFYEPHLAKVYDAKGEKVSLNAISGSYHKKEHALAKINHPELNPLGKSKKLKTIKISLGFKCNYSCSYCSQSVARSYHEPNPTEFKVDSFIKKLGENIELQKNGQDLKFEFWGGEPFAYWSSLKYLGNRLRELYPLSKFSVVTNGTLLDDEKIDWLDKLGFQVAISHDGPGQHIRGKDPLDNPRIRDYISKLAKLLAPQERFSFNCVLTKENPSVYAVHEFISQKINFPFFPISTEGVVSIYDQAAQGFAIGEIDNMRPVWQQVFQDTLSVHSAGFAHLSINGTFRMLIDDFFNSIKSERNANSLGQKCGMDREDRIAIDLDGNLLTCQNVSAKDGHKIGHIEDYENVKLTTAKHCQHHDNCQNCPVLQICKGSCMYLDGKSRRPTCDAHFAFNMGLLASAFFILTNKKLKKIESDRVRIEGLREVNF